MCNSNSVLNTVLYNKPILYKLNDHTPASTANTVSAYSADAEGKISADNSAKLITTDSDAAPD